MRQGRRNKSLVLLANIFWVRTRGDHTSWRVRPRSRGSTFRDSTTIFMHAVEKVVKRYVVVAISTLRAPSGREAQAQPAYTVLYSSLVRESREGLFCVAERRLYSRKRNETGDR